MPTAPDDQVFIRWDRLEYTRNDTGDGFDVTAHVTVSVAGQRIKSTTHFIVNDGDDTAPLLSDALDAKREQFVSA
jgi:hypothetical protein